MGRGFDDALYDGRPVCHDGSMRTCRFYVGGCAVALWLPSCAVAIGAYAAPATYPRADPRANPAGASERARATYGLRPARQLSNAGIDVRRIYFITSHMRDAGALSFERRGPESKVTLSFASSTDPHLRGQLDAARWKEIDERSRRLLDPPVEDGGPCLDAWHFVVETGAASRRGSENRPEYAVADMCSHSSHILRIAEIAADSLPRCRSLEPREDPLERLSRCSRLRGDRSAAAIVSNLLGRIGGWGGSGIDAVAVMSPRVEFDWGGQRVSGAVAAAGAWRSRLARYETADFNIDRIEGINGRKVKVTGHFSYVVYADSDDDVRRNLRADFSMLWSNPDVAGFRIDSIVVEPFRKIAASS
ncbi:MAG TPA: hypothetical protein VF605_03420 [Allosphingosinicella sp.]